MINFYRKLNIELGIQHTGLKRENGENPLQPPLLWVMMGRLWCHWEIPGRLRLQMNH